MGRHDVTLICLQILYVQCLYYAMLGVWFIGGHWLGITLHLDVSTHARRWRYYKVCRRPFELAGVDRGWHGREPVVGGGRGVEQDAERALLAVRSPGLMASSRWPN